MLWPSVKYLSDRTGRSIKAVRRALAEIPSDELTVEKGGSPKGGERRANTYHIEAVTRVKNDPGRTTRVQNDPGQMTRVENDPGRNRPRLKSTSDQGQNGLTTRVKNNPPPLDIDPKKNISADALHIPASEVERKPKKQRSNRATESEIIQYCLSRGLPKSDGEYLFAKWEGNGWTNDGKPIRNWKMTIVQWQIRGDILPSHKRNPKPPPARSSIR